MPPILSGRRRFALVAVLLVLAIAATAGNRPGAQPAPAKKAAPGPVEAHFTDGSILKLALAEEERIELHTPYGKLLIPAGDIRRIDFSWRISDEAAGRVDAALADLGHADSDRRDQAGRELLRLREAAYPALLEAAHGSNLEVRSRAEELLDQLRELVPAELLVVTNHDTVHTEHSRIVGRIVTKSLTVRTAQFGQQTLKLADVRSLRAPTAEPDLPENLLPDPGHLASYQEQIGKSFAFKVTGAQPGAGAAYGTKIYTLDSTLATAAVHAGAVKPGQTGVVRVKILGPHPAFIASTRNGVTSHAYGQYAGFEIKR